MAVKTHNDIFPVFDKLQNRQVKESYLKQNAKVIWFTGLSGAGKTLLSSLLEEKLFERGYFCQVLDGDNIRSGINRNLGFTEEERYENIRRVAEVARLFLNCGIITICAFISPTKRIRQMAKDIIGAEDFLEIYVNTPIEACELRDQKGLYKKARAGELKNFTGISAPFEPPENPFLTINNTEPNVDGTVNSMLEQLFPELIFEPDREEGEENFLPDKK